MMEVPSTTPLLSGSTSSASSAPAWSPCPSYKPYRPSPPAESRTSPRSGSVDSMNTATPTTTTSNSAAAAQANPESPTLLPTGKKSLAKISLRAFILGQVAGVSFLATILLLLSPNDSKNYNSSYAPLWRAPFFLASLATFHFLEYYTTARYNTAYATVSAFLLSSNGAAYNLAHTSALAECVTTRLLLPAGYFASTARVFGGVRAQVGLGLALMLVGQVVRTLAMAQAGANFTHTMQKRRREGHVLVTGGVYGVLRHPSYFGFFWWGLGTQLVLGNVVCLVVYAVVLWVFFAERIKKEERLLVRFFGDDYIKYRNRTHVGIPAIS